MSGVTRVVNELQVVASARQAAVKVRDEELEGAVKKAFDAQNFKDITVKVKNGVVRLTGTVPTGTRRLEAAVLARSIQGVRAVEDDLRVAAAELLPGAEWAKGAHVFTGCRVRTWPATQPLTIHGVRAMVPAAGGAAAERRGRRPQADQRRAPARRAGRTGDNGPRRARRVASWLGSSSAGA